MSRRSNEPEREKGECEGKERERGRKGRRRLGSKRGKDDGREQGRVGERE